ncbi:hypothetical protein GCM10023319_61020 [Nocardia iowensis]
MCPHRACDPGQRGAALEKWGPDVGFKDTWGPDPDANYRGRRPGVAGGVRLGGLRFRPDR